MFRDAQLLPIRAKATTRPQEGSLCVVLPSHFLPSRHMGSHPALTTAAFSAEPLWTPFPKVPGGLGPSPSPTGCREVDGPCLHSALWTFVTRECQLATKSPGHASAPRGGLSDPSLCTLSPRAAHTPQPPRVLPPIFSDVRPPPSGSLHVRQWTTVRAGLRCGPQPRGPTRLPPRPPGLPQPALPASLQRLLCRPAKGPQRHSPGAAGAQAV